MVTTTKATPSDFGTKELGDQFETALEPVSQTNLRPRLRILDGRYIDKLLVQKKITVPQWNAADQYYSLAVRANLVGNVRSWLGKIGKITSGRQIASDSQITSLCQLRIDRDGLDEAVGRVERSVLDSIVVEDMSIHAAARRAEVTDSRAQKHLLECLDYLVKTYGMTAFKR